MKVEYRSLNIRQHVFGRVESVIFEREIQLIKMAGKRWHNELVANVILTAYRFDLASSTTNQRFIIRGEKILWSSSSHSMCVMWRAFLSILVYQKCVEVDNLYSSIAPVLLMRINSGRHPAGDAWIVNVIDFILHWKKDTTVLVVAKYANFWF